MSSSRMLCSVVLLLLSVSLAMSQSPEELQSLGAEEELFNGVDLKGWIFYSKHDDAVVEDIWSVTDGVLKCTGKPRGYLQTKRWYRDYELELQWRWSGEEGGNNGVLVHSTTPLMFHGWPKSMEVQLRSGDAGDFWVIGKEVDIRVDDEENRRAKPVAGNQHTHRRIKRLDVPTETSIERPIGQWNTMRIICDGDTVTVFVNGHKVNHGTQCTVDRGGISLQSEGTPAEFRNIRVKPLK